MDLPPRLDYPPGEPTNLPHHTTATNGAILETGSHPIGENSINPVAHNSIPAHNLNPQAQGFTYGALNNPHDFVIQHAVMIERAPPSNNTESIDLLAQNCIPGAQFDSGERYPPPSCHPGTRLEILKKFVSWMRDITREYKIMWLHGPAGVGKSAVIQTLAEAEANFPTSVLGATIFFSRPNERDDPRRVFITISYQLAVRYPTYRTYVINLLVRDPLVVKKSPAEQFKWLITIPIAEQKLLGDSQETTLIMLDGLDECNSELAQREIIFLISKFCLQHPTTPVIWVVSSRPEPGICAAFSHQNVRGAYLEIDMPINSDEACRDVERYLRDDFAEIKDRYSTSFPSGQQWPTEIDFTKIAKRSSGLFAFADTVVRFIGDGEYANPVAQLQKTLDIFESASSHTTDDTPFAVLDALYTLILSTVHAKVLPTFQKLYAIRKEFRFFSQSCDVLSISQAEAYGALQKLHSILDVPQPKESHRNIRSLHTSFDDYITSPSRSGSFWIDPLGAENLVFSGYARVLREAHNADSTISFSNVKVSWSDQDTDPMQQQLLFLFALDYVLDASPLRRSDFATLRTFFQDLDYANLGRLFMDSRLIYEVKTFLDSILLRHFDEWGVITSTSVWSLDLNFIALNEATYIYQNILSPPEQTDSNWDVDYALPRTIPTVFGSLPASRADWYQRITVLRDELLWKDHIHKHLTGLPPSHPVTVLGKGNKSLVLVKVNEPQGSWCYMLPYRPT